MNTFFLNNCKESCCNGCFSKWVTIKNSCEVCREVKCFKLQKIKKVYYDLTELPEDDMTYLIEILNDVFPEFYLYNPFTEEEFEQIKEKINKDSHAKKIFESLNNYNLNKQSKKEYYII
uniref:Uncharacterized protein n=1 Tax=viral metagenome TaxID=1070528 RepID=A0A6C0I9U9_9ZZZZ